MKNVWALVTKTGEKLQTTKRGQREWHAKIHGIAFAQHVSISKTFNLETKTEKIFYS